MSGIGKGITAASIGRLLENYGYNVIAIKIDPYLNIDAGTMNPYQHGEVFVLADGCEVDLDLGHYERFLDVELSRDHNITTGKVYKSVIEKERRGDYLGKTVQIIPHVTDEIKNQIKSTAEKSDADICIVEVGGTVGDIESMPFLEAVRQMHIEEICIFIHVTLIPTTVQGEQKTKPTQHSVKALREAGLSPNVIVCRCEDFLSEEVKSKISLSCDVPKRGVISAPNVENIYEIPLLLDKEGLDEYLMEKLRIRPRGYDSKWREMIEKMHSDCNIKIAIIGKYTGLEDSYLSIKEALRHAAISNECNIDLKWVESEYLDEKDLSDAQGIIIPGGFGTRGTEGKLRAIKYARENNVPLLGLCFGFQLVVVEFARNALGIKDANSSELSDTENPVIDVLPEQRDVINKGGTMRLGNYTIEIEEGSLAHRIYKTRTITERHRHRYEVNPLYVDQMREEGLIFSGKHKDRMEILELPSHRFFMATQFHPEFKSRPGKPSPVFEAFVHESKAYYND